MAHPGGRRSATYDSLLQHRDLQPFSHQKIGAGRTDDPRTYNHHVVRGRSGFHEMPQRKGSPSAKKSIASPVMWASPVMDGTTRPSFTETLPSKYVPNIPSCRQT